MLHDCHQLNRIVTLFDNPRHHNLYKVPVGRNSLLCGADAHVGFVNFQIVRFLWFGRDPLVFLLGGRVPHALLVRMTHLVGLRDVGCPWGQSVEKVSMLVSHHQFDLGEVSQSTTTVLVGWNDQFPFTKLQLLVRELFPVPTVEITGKVELLRAGCPFITPHRIVWLNMHTILVVRCGEPVYTAFMLFKLLEEVQHESIPTFHLILIGVQISIPFQQFVQIWDLHLSGINRLGLAHDE
uniref:Uncharacterized protein n=1 Tax=Cacopsylla melanoneura TaxID=428564 RepID=A0A8D8XJL1_9HEMI